MSPTENRPSRLPTALTSITGSFKPLQAKAMLPLEEVALSSPAS